jgi:hypothetical protein
LQIHAQNLSNPPKAAHLLCFNHTEAALPTELSTAGVESPIKCYVLPLQRPMAAICPASEPMNNQMMWRFR